MKGLEKMTALILDEAKAAADAILAEAEKEAEAILEDYRCRAREEMAAEVSKAESEASRKLERAKASAGQIHRNTLLAAKSALLDDVFTRALDALVNLPDAERLKLYQLIFAGVLKDQLAAEQTAVANDLYGEYTLPLTYTLYLSSRDYTAIGKQFSEAVSESLQSAGKTLVLSDQAALIAGGFILACGDVELCCSLAGYMERIRSQIEGEVCQILFS